MATNNANNNTSYGLTINTTGSPTTFNTQGIYSNLNQPYFKAFLNTSVSNATGNGAIYTVVFDTILADPYNEYNTTTGAWVPTHTGVYLISYGVSLQDLTGIGTSAILSLTNAGTSTGYATYYNPATISSPTDDVGSLTNSVVEIINPSGFVLSVTIQVSGGIANAVGVFGSTGGPLSTYFSAIKIL
jgi:hypothetical protein